MAAKLSELRPHPTPQLGVNGHRRAIKQNAILREFSTKECESFFSRLEYVHLPAAAVLNEMGQTIPFAYFITSGLVSIVTVMSDGKSVEVALTGSEGFVGLPLTAGFDTSPTRAIVQLEGHAFRMTAGNMLVTLRDCAKLNSSLQRYSQELFIQSAQVGACNRLHEVEERLARWLLMSQDRVENSSLALTQETLSHMLGTRRASVTVAAGIPQKAGLITYRRGLVRIKDRRGLEQAACECYGTINRQVARWQKRKRASR